jgi:hypothetical protein
MKSIYKRSNSKRSSKGKRSTKKGKRSSKGKRSTKKGKRTTKQSRKGKRNNKRNMKKTKGMRGGGCCGPNNFETGGKPWGANRWPAVTPNPHDGSYYPLNMNAIDPPMPVNQLQYGGGFLSSILPADILTASRGLVEGVKSNYYGWKGIERPYSSYPLPTDQPILDNEKINYVQLPVDMQTIHTNAGKNVI